MARIFVFTNDLKWIVRMQKDGSGEQTLYLYRLGRRATSPRPRSRSPTWRGPL